MDPQDPPAEIPREPDSGARPGAAAPHINGPVRVVAGAPSSKMKAWAKDMLGTFFANYEPQERGAGKEPTYEEDAIVSADSLVAGPGEKRIRLEDLLTQALGGIGFSKVGKLAYRAGWSTAEVEHIVFFEAQGVPKIFLSANAGMRNAEAEAFAERCQRKYTIPLIRNSKPVPQTWWCPMHFALSNLPGWKDGRHLNMLGLSQAELAQTITDEIGVLLKPSVGRVTSCERLIDFLIRDDEPMRWFRVGGFYRAALIVVLARELGVGAKEIEATLRPIAREVLHGVDPAQTGSGGYVADLIRDADLSIAGKLA